MTISRRILVCAALVSALLIEPAAATEESPKKQDVASADADNTAKKPKKPKTHTVRKEPFTVKVTLDGVFEAENMNEVALRPREWKQFEVLDAVEHGARVNRGDRLVSLDTRKLDETIAELEASLKISALDLDQTQGELVLLEELLPLEIESAERSQKRTDEDLLRFLKTDRPMSEKTADFYLKAAKDRLEYQEEELRQLEKMYAADDLTEETEEIILKRARDNVEWAKFYVETSRVRRDRTLGVELPRAEERLTELARRRTLALETSQKKLRVLVEKTRLALAKTEYEREKNSAKLERLRSDLAAMTVRSPADGIVYYGKCVDGKWTGRKSMAGKLRHGGKISEHEVFMTVVDPESVFVRAAVPEKELRHVHTGLRGRVAPIVLHQEKLTANVSAVSAVPTGEKTFDAHIALNSGEDQRKIAAGMTCEVEFVPYAKEKAIAVPSSAVFSYTRFTEDGPEESSCVYVYKDGEHEKRTVRTGETSKKKVEILAGLEAGEEILQKEPEDD